MTLVQQLETIRTQQGRAIAHPYDKIPCIETSDVARLCKAPVVSIMVLAYNHEKYIRECLDSLVCQQTNFPYEIVIGEDCSTDNTRAICFEYQKRFPDKIRVLWSEENLYSYGGNELRVRYKCRGEFVAYCEGDDYWTDPLKLQKQVDLIRAKDAVMCVAFTDWVYSDRVVHSTYDAKEYITSEDLKHHYFHTTTYLMRRDVFMSLDERFPRFVNLHDMQIEFCMADCGKISLLPEIVSAYRWSGAGIATRLNRLTTYAFTMRMMSELFFHGPWAERRYFAVRTRAAIDGVIMENRGYAPVRISFAQFSEALVAHVYFFLQAFGVVSGSRMLYECRYYLSVIWYLTRIITERIGLRWREL